MIYNKDAGVDFHIHSKISNDGYYTLEEIFKKAWLAGLEYFAITDHNSFNGVIKFIEENNLPTDYAMHELEDYKFIPGAEFTCKLPEVKDNRGRSFKLHAGVYGPVLNPMSPILALSKLKRQNDIEVDFGVLVNIARSQGIELDPERIRNYLIARRMSQPGFSSFDADSIYSFLKKEKIKISKSWKSFYNLYQSMPKAERVNLDVDDVIKLCHASGGLFIMDHPATNLRRCRCDRDKKKVIEHLLEAGADGFEMGSQHMDKDCYDFIDGICKKFNPKNPIIYSAGSDMHIESDAISAGKLGMRRLLVRNYRDMVGEMETLQRAREEKSLTHRNYDPISKEEIESTLLGYWRSVDQKDIFHGHPFEME